MPPEFVVPNSVAGEVWDYLRRQLFLRKEYHPGAFIRETDVAAKLHVSRSPVREAIKELEAHGIVKSIPRKGALVVTFTPEDVQEIYDVRLILEMMVYNKIVEKGLLTEDHYRWLLWAVERFEEVSQKVDQDRDEALSRFFDLDCEFHFYIHDLSGLTWVSDLLKRTYSRMYLVQLCQISKQNLHNLSVYHHQLVENLRKGDLETLRHLSVQSYLSGQAYYLGEEPQFSLGETDKKAP